MQRGWWRIGLCVLVSIAGCGERLSAGDMDDEGAAETDSGETETDTGETDTGSMLSPEDLAEIEAVEGELEAIVAGTLAYFAETQPEGTPHLCPHPDGSPAGGEASWTPALGFNCNEGPGGKCLPIDEAGAGHYSTEFWTLNSVWAGVGWARELGVAHEFHYNLIALNEFGDFGACEFTAMAQADFDDDGVFSSYSISGSVDEFGEVVGELVVEDPFE